MMVDSERLVECIFCDALVRIVSSTNAHPEAPELFSVPHGAAIGFVYANDGSLKLFVTCSEDCRTQLLEGAWSD
jgi:hypothetical protein